MAGGGDAAPAGANPGATGDRAVGVRPAGSAAQGGPPGCHAGRALLVLVEKKPGITVAEAAERLRTRPASLYQVTSRLRKEGRVRKEGRGFHKSG